MNVDPQGGVPPEEGGSEPHHGRDGGSGPGPGDEEYEATRVQRGAALVVAAGMIVLIAGTVMRLSAGSCLSARSVPALDYSCTGVIAEPWFGAVALVTVAAAAVGSVLAIRDLTAGRRGP